VADKRSTVSEFSGKTPEMFVLKRNVKNNLDQQEAEDRAKLNPITKPGCLAVFSNSSWVSYILEVNFFKVEVFKERELMMPYDYLLGSTWPDVLALLGLQAVQSA